MVCGPASATWGANAMTGAVNNTRGEPSTRTRSFPGDETDTGIRRSTPVTLYDSSELARTGTRKFHTTWADVNGTKQRHKEIDQCQ